MKNNFCYKFIPSEEMRYISTPSEEMHYISNVIDFEFDNLDGFVKVYTDNGISCLRQDQLILFGWTKDFNFEV